MKYQNEDKNILITNIKESYFNLVTIILKNLSLSSNTKVIFVIIELCQLLHLPFQDKYDFIWLTSNDTSIKYASTSGKIIKFIKIISSYSSLYPLTKGNEHIYYIFLIISILLTLIPMLIVGLLCYKLSHSHMTITNMFPKTIGVFMLTLTSILFTPLIMMFCSACVEQHVHIALCVVCIVVMVVYVGFTLIIVNTFIDVSAIHEKNILSVNDSYIESMLILFKVFVILTSMLVNDNSIMILLVCITCMFVILLLVYNTSNYDLTKPFAIYQIHSIFLSIILWLHLLFLIGFLLYPTTHAYAVDRSVLLFSFIIGSFVIIIGYKLLSKRINVFQLNRSLSSNLLVRDYLCKIRNLIYLCMHKDSQRKYQILLNGYLYLYTQEYNEQKPKFIVLLHIEWIFNNALRKYPFNALIRIEHAIFLKEYLYKYDKALMEVLNAKRFERVSFSEEFMLYMLEKDLESKSYEKGKNDKQQGISNSNFGNVSNNNSNNTFTYKALSKRLISLINKVSLLYIEFWSLLLNNDNSIHNDMTNHVNVEQHANTTSTTTTTSNKNDSLKRLNDLGEKINDLVESIHITYNKTQKLNPYDFEIISHYASFHSEILNDRATSSQLKTQLRDLSYDTKTNLDNKNLCQMDLNKLASTGDYCCVVFGADDKNLGTITHISLRLCAMLGYTKNELLGRHINTVLPELYVNAHNKYLKQVLDDYRNKYCIGSGQCYTSTNKDERSFEVKFKDIETFYKNKSKYLIPVNIRFALFHSEKSSFYFIHKLISYDHNNVNNRHQYCCYVLTSPNLSIQNFSSSAITYLNLRSTFINKTITDHIKQFQEDFLKLIVDYSENENKNNLYTLLTPIYSHSSHYMKQKSNVNRINQEITKRKLQLRNDLLKQKYFTPTLITWVDSVNCTKDLNGTNITTTNSINTTNITQHTVVPLSGSKKKNNYDKNNFILTVHEHNAYGMFVGYLFEFELLWHYNQKLLKPRLNNMMKTITNSSETTTGSVVNKKKKPVSKNFHTFRNLQTKNLKLTSLDSSQHSNNNNEDGLVSFVVDSYKKRKQLHLDSFKVEHHHKTALMQFVDKSFIPKIESHQIAINPLSLAYEHYTDDNKRITLQEEIKQMALKKVNESKVNVINNNNNNVTSSSSSSSSTDEELSSVYDSDDNSCAYDESESSRFSKDKRNVIKYNNNNNTTKPKSKHNSNNNNIHVHYNNESSNNNSYLNKYYHVNLDNIKLFIYDYKLHSAIESKPSSSSPSSSPHVKVPQCYLSQMEHRMFEETLLQSNQLIRMNSISSDPKTKRNSSLIKTLPSSKLKYKETPKTSLTPHDILIKEIEIALRHNDSSRSICLLYIMSLIGFCLISTKYIIFLLLIRNYMSNLQHSFVTLANTYSVTSNYLLSLYYVREATLCNISDYNIKDNKREEYLMYHLRKVDELFISTEKMLSLILVSKIQLSEQQNAKLNSIGGEMYFIQTSNELEYYKGIITTRFRTVISTINIALSHISNSTLKDMYPYNKDVYFFLQNGFNSVMTGLSEQNEFFKVNVRKVYDEYKILIVVMFILTEVFFVFGYLAIRVGLKGVIKKKNSYLTVFFEISRHLVQHLLTKCEKFSIKIQKLDTDEQQVISTHSELMSRSTFYSNDNDNDIEQHVIDMKSISNANTKKQRKGAKRKHNHYEQNYSKDILNTSYELIIFIVLLFIADLIVLIVVVNKYNQIQYAIMIYISENNIYFSVTSILNTLREFLLDETSTVKYTNTSVLINSILDKYHPTITSENEVIRRSLTQLPKSFYETYYRIYHTNICSISNDDDEFMNYYYKSSNTTSCEAFTDQTAMFGLDKILMYFSEDIRNLRGITHSARKFQKEFKFNYNYSMYGTPYYEATYLPKDQHTLDIYLEYGPFSILNSNMHDKLRFNFQFLIIPSFTALFNDIMNGVYKNISNIQLLTLIQTSIEGAVLVILFIFFWLKFIKSLNVSIYKTKNMLTIIPRDVLASVWNIRQLLDIESTNNNNNSNSSSNSRADSQHNDNNINK